MTYPVPPWLHSLSVFSLTISGIAALVICIDVLSGHRQRMWIMDLVWPITALWAGPWALWAYFTIGRRNTKRVQQEVKEHGGEPLEKDLPFGVSVALGATHCGAGCTLGDLIAESFVVLVPLGLFGSHLLGTWALDLVLAFLIGIVFQYFTIAPMRDLSFPRGVLAAVKADTLSLCAWQLGMYGWMAVVVFLLFGELPKDGPVFWCMMQLAMVFGFITSYPANWWLLRKGWKERM